MNSFAERHAQVDPDPLKELIRRQQSWAMCPPEPGEDNLKPHAQIVPCETIHAAIREIVYLRRRASILDRIAVRLRLLPKPVQ